MRMKERLLEEFYRIYFNGAIPYTSDGRIVDYINIQLIYYLRGLAIQEMKNAGHKIDGTNPQCENEISYIIHSLKDEMFMDTHDRSVARVKRTILFGNIFMTDEDIEKRAQEEINTAEFQSLSSMLDYYRKQVEGYRELCVKYGMNPNGNNYSDSDNIVIKERI